MAQQEYNGWKNYETWNVALWLGNDEGLYNQARDFVRCMKKHGCRIFGGEAESFVREVLPQGTPDFNDRGKRQAYRKVHWPSIAGMMRELA